MLRHAIVWYTFEVQLLEADNVAVRPGASARRVALVASSDNPERGGILWVGDTRQPGSLFIRAERQGRTPYRRFVAEVEPNLPGRSEDNSRAVGHCHCLPLGDLRSRIRHHSRRYAGVGTAALMSDRAGS